MIGNDHWTRLALQAPNKMLLDAMIGAYHPLFMPFAYRRHLALPRGVRLGSALPGVAGLSGLILTVYFPRDARWRRNSATVAVNHRDLDTSPPPGGGLASDQPADLGGRG